MSGPSPVSLPPAGYVVLLSLSPLQRWSTEGIVLPSAVRELLTRGTDFVTIAAENCFQLSVEMKITEKRISTTLRQRGCKLTPQRRAIIKTVIQSQGHLTPADVYERLHEEHPSIGLVTVYRTIEILAQAGLICEVHIGGSCHSYLIRRPPEHHHHLVCSGCGKVVDFTDCELGELEGRLSQETGFEIHSHLLEFLGRCHDCQKMALV